ncbi:MAG: type II toxin-antitoxin system VapC family toxin [Thermoguttaceae bacterium]|jgi:tRNA(fMet)-specific endonuclease VapC|nr:type II toxin-antitoxin system VapC family toxin [Thermoguttaceae bacterium]
MPYLLDTNTCIEYLRGRNAAIIERIRNTVPDELRLCSVVKAELFYGAYRSAYVSANLALLSSFFSAIPSLPFDDAASHVYGKLRANLAGRGALIGPNDLQIAAIAVSNGLVLVTHNTLEFGRVSGLAIEDWQVPSS